MVRPFCFQPDNLIVFAFSSFGAFSFDNFCNIEYIILIACELFPLRVSSCLLHFHSISFLRSVWVFFCSFHVLYCLVLSSGPKVFHSQFIYHSVWRDTNLKIKPVITVANLHLSPFFLSSLTIIMHKNMKWPKKL